MILRVICLLGAMAASSVFGNASESSILSDVQGANLFERLTNAYDRRGSQPKLEDFAPLDTPLSFLWVEKESPNKFVPNPNDGYKVNAYFLEFGHPTIGLVRRLYFGISDSIASLKDIANSSGAPILEVSDANKAVFSRGKLRHENQDCDFVNWYRLLTASSGERAIVLQTLNASYNQNCQKQLKVDFGRAFGAALIILPDAAKPKD